MFVSKAILLLNGSFVSNVGTASYHLAKYLAKLLSPLSKSQCIVNSTKEFTGIIKNERVPSTHQMIYFDVCSKVTMVPLNYTINVTLK